jgi:L-asparaginase II
VTDPLVVEVVRSGLVEAVHLVDVAVGDRSGAVHAAAGDPGRATTFRSSAKPIQGAVCLAEGWAPSREEHIAIACASHNGESQHVEEVRGILADAGIPEEALGCPPASPSYPERTPGGDPTRLHHNCSGKHAAFLATCAARGWPLASYLEPDHPLQRAVFARIEALAGFRPSVGVDGCGAPTFALPLVSVTRAFTLNALGEPRVTAGMRAHPFLVAGTERLCTDLMRAAEGLVVKVGAEGLLCACSVRDGVGIGLKVRDGAGRAREAAAVFVLRELGLLGPTESGSLERHERPAVLGGGREVGRLRVRGALVPEHRV